MTPSYYLDSLLNVKPLLADKVIVIVGGTSGLGFSAARACLDQGASVVVTGRDKAKVELAQSQLGDRCRGLALDATQPDSTESAIELALSTFGRFDGLYHVAGGSGRSVGDGPLHELTDLGITHTTAWNLHATIYSNRAAVRAFLRLGTAGSILNMGSVLGFSPAPDHFSTHVYAATKAAIEGLTTSCAAYYAPHDIRFNVVAPGLIETPMAQRAARNPDIQAYIREKQPLDGGRIGQPHDLDGAVVLLLSDQARFITGQIIRVDGGWSVSEATASSPTPPDVPPRGGCR